MDYKKISQDVVDHVGGISNIKGATHCDKTSTDFK